jgi:hypothetical protein
VLLLRGCMMIIIPLSTEDLTKVRIAPSPLWRRPTSPEPSSGLSPPLAAQGRGAGQATAPRQESLLPLERCRRVATRNLRGTGVAQLAPYLSQGTCVL